MFLKKILCK